MYVLCVYWARMRVSASLMFTCLLVQRGGEGLWWCVSKVGLYSIIVLRIDGKIAKCAASETHDAVPCLAFYENQNQYDDTWELERMDENTSDANIPAGSSAVRSFVRCFSGCKEVANPQILINWPAYESYPQLLGYLAVGCAFEMVEMWGEPGGEGPQLA